MWKKTFGFALLVFVLSVTLSGCYSRRAYYRDGFAPGYVHVRIVKSHGHGAFVPGYRSYGPSYRHFDDHRYDGRHSRKFKHKQHYNEYERRHR